MHFAPARQALLAEAHVYVEKPFVEIESEARELLALARDRDRLVCAGHQQLRDPAYLALRSRIPALGPVARVDSHFAFRPVGLIPELQYQFSGRPDLNFPVRPVGWLASLRVVVLWEIGRVRT